MDCFLLCVYDTISRYGTDVIPKEQTVVYAILD